MTRDRTQFPFDTLYMDSEFSGADYVDDYAKMPGIDGPLWHDRTIPIVGVCGEIGQGKTTFLLDIARGPIQYVNMRQAMQQVFPSGYRPIDLFSWWHALVKKIPVGRFRVIALDVAEEIEQGASDWVWEHPLDFNCTREQFLKMRGIFQGIVSSFWKVILADLAARCETFAFANHMGLEWKDDKPTGTKKAKGRPVLRQLASLYIKLERPKDAAGRISPKPAGSVDLAEGGKARLRRPHPNGEDWIPILPPRLPEATPAAIRRYILQPPNWQQLKPEELNPEHPLTEQQKLDMRLQVAQAEADTERLRLERIEKESRHGGSEAAATLDAGDVQATGMESAPEGMRQPEPADSAAPNAGSPAPSEKLGSGDGQAQLTPTAPASSTPETISGPATAAGAPVADFIPPPDPALAEKQRLSQIAAPIVDGKPKYRANAIHPEMEIKDYHHNLRVLLDDLGTVMGFTPEQHGSMKLGLLKRFGVTEVAALNNLQLAQAEDLIVAQFRKAYLAKGLPEEKCPF